VLDAIHDVIDVSTGSVAVSCFGPVMQASGIGSCIVALLLEPVVKVAGMAHIMLPGHAPEQAPEPLKYAENAMDELLRRMEAQGVRHEHILTCLAGGANVLKRPDDAICEANIQSVLGIVKRWNLKVVAEDLGGVERRMVVAETRRGLVFQHRGDRSGQLLFDLHLQ